MSDLLAIDPGATHSAYVVIDTADCRPRDLGKLANDRFVTLVCRSPFLPRRHTVIEMVASYGMPVGAEVFETCVWIGRFAQQIEATTGRLPQRIPRGPIKLHHCHAASARDSNIRQALVDRFTPGQRNHGKGTKAERGWFYGFHTDIWQAYALAVYAADTMEGRA